MVLRIRNFQQYLIQIQNNM